MTAPTTTPTSTAPANAPATPPAVRKKAGPLGLDWGLLLVVGVLVAFGLMMVYSTTFDWSYRDFDSPTTVFFRQVRSLLIGLAIMVMFARLDYHRLKRLAVPMLAMTILALVVVLFLGSRVFNSVRGLLGGSYQPSELAKLVLVIYLGVWLTSKGDMIRHIGYGLIPYGIVVGVVAGLILLEPDVSATLTVVLVGAVMFFLAGADLLQIVLTGLVSAAAGYAIVMTSTTARDRIAEYLVGLTNITETSWHVQQAIIAFINGGLFGRGLGESHQKFQALPTPHTDSVFAVVGEELGLIGCLCLIALFAVLVWRGSKIAVNAKDSLGAMLAAGITAWIAFEVLINIGVMVAALPFAGNALPFISYGGSSLVVTLAGVGLLLSISRHDPDVSIPRKTRAAFDYSRWNRRPRLPRAGRRQ
jgi:cell division protein FtsW